MDKISIKKSFFKPIITFDTSLKDALTRDKNTSTRQLVKPVFLTALNTLH